MLHAAPELQLIQIIDCCNIKISWSDGPEIHLLTDMYAMMEKVLFQYQILMDFKRVKSPIDTVRQFNIAYMSAYSAY